MTNGMPEQLNEFLSRTGNLLIHLLNRCNLKCKHCYLEASPDGNAMLPMDLIERTIEEAHLLRLSAVQFSGGEPLLYPGIKDILKLTENKCFKVYLSTNATLIDDAFASLLSDLNIFVVASIDGPPAYHDSFRGKTGSFEKAQAGLTHLANHGVKFKVVMTVCSENIRYLDWCADWAHGMKAETLQIQPLEKTGRGFQIESLRLSHDQMNDLFIHLNDLAVKYKNLGMKISMTYQSRDYMLAHPCKAFVCNGKNCHRGVEKELKKIVIREDGIILPELVNIDPRFAIGNLYSKSLTENIRCFLENKYAWFDRLCRDVYNDTVPDYPSQLIFWNEILMERSWTYCLDYPGISAQSMC